MGMRVRYRMMPNVTIGMKLGISRRMMNGLLTLFAFMAFEPLEVKGFSYVRRHIKRHRRLEIDFLSLKLGYGHSVSIRSNRNDNARHNLTMKAGY